MISVKLVGAAELERAMRQLPDEIAGKVLRAALREAAEPMAEAARRAAPRSDTAHRGGHMADSIKLRAFGGSTDLFDIETRLWLGPDRHHFYAFFHEFGTRFRGARAFMRPAFDVEVRGTIDRFGAVLGPAIERAARRLAQ